MSKNTAADVVVVTDIIRQVLSIDSDYQDRRAAWTDSPNEEICYYLWRRKLLSRAGRIGRLIAGGKSDRRNEYLVLRERELARRFSANLSQTNSSFDELSTSSSTSQPTTTTTTTTITTPRGGTTASAVSNSDLFAFAGLHHIFGEQKQSVSVVKFANETKDLLAFGCADGTISICTVVSRPARIALLKGHFGAITDLDWGITNDFIVSSSQDKTIRVWQARSGLCTRILQTTQACMCCAFHPLNNNFFATGTKAAKGNKGIIQMMNVSTGRCASAQQTNGLVRTCSFDDSGNFLFVGDDSSTITTFKVSPNGSLQSLFRKSLNGIPWSVEYKAWNHHGKFEPLLLSICKDNTARVFSITMKTGELLQVSVVSVPTSKSLVRARFCPLLATRPSPCIVSGGDNGCIYIFDLGKPSTHSSPINTLQGHSCAVHDVSWSYDETLLASCDDSGAVLIWKRVLKVNS